MVSSRFFAFTKFTPVQSTSYSSTNANTYPPHVSHSKGFKPKSSMMRAQRLSFSLDLLTHHTQLFALTIHARSSFSISATITEPWAREVDTCTALSKTRYVALDLYILRMARRHKTVLGPHRKKFTLHCRSVEL